MNDVRPWTAAALIGALWGALELSLGSALHLSRMPFRGLLMAMIGLFCLVTLQRLRGKPGVCLAAGGVAAFLKIFALGGLYPGPVFGILLEAFIIELVFMILGTRRSAAVLGGAVVLALTPLEMLFMLLVAAGPETLHAAVGGLLAAAARAGFGSPEPGPVLGLLVAAAALCGAVTGSWAWSLAGRVGRRLEG